MTTSVDVSPEATVTPPNDTRNSRSQFPISKNTSPFWSLETGEGAVADAAGGRGSRVAVEEELAVGDAQDAGVGLDDDGVLPGAALAQAPRVACAQSNGREGEEERGRVQESRGMMTS